MEDIAKAAIEKYGAYKQIDIAIEELSELIHALSKYKRHRASNVEEELADVKICIEQLELMFDKHEVETWVEAKKQRLRNRIESVKTDL